MRALKDLSTDEACDVLCEIAPEIQSIVEDESLMETIGKPIDAGNLTVAGARMTATGRVVSMIPLLLKTHRNALYGILAAISGEPKENIASQSIGETMQMARDAMNDELLMGFFTLSGRGGKTGS